MRFSLWPRLGTICLLATLLYTGVQCNPASAPDNTPIPPGVVVTPGSGGPDGNGSGNPNNPYTPPSTSTPVSEQTITVPSLLPWGVWSGTLEAGVTYTLEASGTWFYGDDMEADAKWYRKAGSQTWEEQHLFRDEGWELLINDERVNWLGTTDGTSFAELVFSPTHVYRASYVGEGKAIRIAIEDSLYDNNVGELTVRIFR